MNLPPPQHTPPRPSDSLGLLPPFTPPPHALDHPPSLSAPSTINSAPSYRPGGLLMNLPPPQHSGQISLIPPSPPSPSAAPLPPASFGYTLSEPDARPIPVPSYQHHHENEDHNQDYTPPAGAPHVRGRGLLANFHFVQGSLIIEFKNKMDFWCVCARLANRARAVEQKSKTTQTSLFAPAR